MGRRRLGEVVQLGRDHPGRVAVHGDVPGPQFPGEHAGEAYKTVRGELEAYGHGLGEKTEIVALSQADTIDAATRKKKLAALKRAAGRAPPVCEPPEARAPSIPLQRRRLQRP